MEPPGLDNLGAEPPGSEHPLLRLLNGGKRDDGWQPEPQNRRESAAGPGGGAEVIHLEKHFLAKQIRNHRSIRRQPGALVLLRVFNPREPA